MSQLILEGMTALCMEHADYCHKMILLIGWTYDLFRLRYFIVEINISTLSATHVDIRNHATSQWLAMVVYHAFHLHGIRPCTGPC